MAGILGFGQSLKIAHQRSVGAFLNHFQTYIRLYMVNFRLILYFLIQNETLGWEINFLCFLSRYLDRI